MRSEKVEFTGFEGQKLAGRLDWPSGKPKAFALWAHCFSCTKDIFAASRVAKALNDHGFAVLRFDFTGLGASEGDFANTNFSSNVQDLVLAADYLRQNHDAPSILIGHSLGGAAVLVAAQQVPESKAVCTIGAPADPAHVAHHFTDHQEEIKTKGEAQVLLSGRPFTIKKQFLDDIQSQKMENHIGSLKKALLVFHSPLDKTVGIENAASIFQAAKHPKSFVSLDAADHLLSRRSDAIYVAQLITAWADRYVEDQSTPKPSSTVVADNEIVVEEAGSGKFTNTVSVGGRHHLFADEPLSVPGARDLGPSPYDLLMAGLGACKSMTMRMYAERKKFPLEKAIVRLKHQKIHAQDCEACETKEGRIDQIEIAIELEGDLSEEQRQAIKAISDRCPVHKTLQSEIEIIKKDD